MRGSVESPALIETETELVVVSAQASGAVGIF